MPRRARCAGPSASSAGVAAEPVSARPGQVVGLFVGLLLTLLLPTATAADFDHAHPAWTQLLARHVAWNAEGTASAVDYAGFAADRAALGDYLDRLAGVSEVEFAAWSEPRRQAFLINAYNAWTVELVLTRHPRIRSIKEIGGWFSSPWKQPIARLLGAVRSLDDIEHGLLRGAPGFAEPRIHFAVNCASIGCPALRDEAYDADRLDAQLEDQTRRFLADRSRNRLSGEAPVRAELSAIFSWYGKDFGDHASLGRFLAERAAALQATPVQTDALRSGNYRLRLLDYDWALNAAR